MPMASCRITTEDTKRQSQPKQKKTTKNPRRSIAEGDERTAHSHSTFLSKVRSPFSSCALPLPRSFPASPRTPALVCCYPVVSLHGHGRSRTNANAAPKGGAEPHLGDCTAQAAGKDRLAQRGGAWSSPRSGCPGPGRRSSPSPSPARGLRGGRDPRPEGRARRRRPPRSPRPT